MKLYIFTLNHLSTVQKGIQAAHVTAEIMDSNRFEDVDTWFNDHKTIIMLQGGNYGKLQSIKRAAKQSSLAYAYFIEDGETLGELLTAVAVVADKEQWAIPSEDNEIMHYIRTCDKVTQ